MKTSLLALLAATALLAGCGDKSKTAPGGTTVSNLVTAPVDYLGAVVQAQKHAEKVIDVSYINQAIQLFNAQEGRLPKDLEELVPNYLGKIPAAPFGYKIVYDATAGTVKVVKQQP
jgi:outer membrane murein-binding lipoprotein Lpp